MSIIKKRDYTLLGNLSDEEGVLSEFEDFTADAYVGDAIMEIADGATPIYHSDIWEHAKDISEYIEEAIASGLAEGLPNLEQTFQMGYYGYYSQSLYKNLDIIVFNMITCTINDFLEKLDDEIFENLELDEIEQTIERVSENFDNSKRISYINDLANGIIADIEDGLFNIEQLKEVE